MADENDKIENEAPAEEPQAEAPAQDAPADEPQAEAPADEAPATEPEAEAPAAEEAPADEAPAEVAEEPVAEAAPAEPEEKLHPKEARKRARSRNAGAAKPARTVEERIAERAEERRRKAAARRSYRVKARAKAKERKAAAPAPEAPPVHGEDHGRKTKRVRQGVVVSDKADKTITVRIDTSRRHRRYEKIVRSSSTLHAHDESNDANTGDTVIVVEARPTSRTKRWRLVEVVERAK